MKPFDLTISPPHSQVSQLICLSWHFKKIELPFKLDAAAVSFARSYPRRQDFFSNRGRCCGKMGDNSNNEISLRYDMPCKNPRTVGIANHLMRKAFFSFKLSKERYSSGICRAFDLWVELPSMACFLFES